MREHGWETDEWPDIYPGILDSDILVVAGPIWLGDNSSVTKQVIERIYALSGELNDKGQYLFYGRVAGCLITGNEDGIKHCAQNILYSLQHVGYTIPPNADAGWIGEAGPGPSYLDPGSGGPENDFTNRNTTFMTWNLMHLARMLKDAGGVPGYGNQRSEWNAGARFDFENPEYRVLSWRTRRRRGRRRALPVGGRAGVMRDYHDNEWGNRVRGEAAYLERLTLEAFQSGLSWSTILNKREAFREVFHGFDAERDRGVRRRRRGAADGRRPDRAQPRQDLGRGRQRAGDRRAAGRRRAWRRSCCLRPDRAARARRRPRRWRPPRPSRWRSPRTLKKHGFAFVGPTTMYALMEAIGVFDAHLVGCHRRGAAPPERGSVALSPSMTRKRRNYPIERFPHERPCVGS